MKEQKIEYWKKKYKTVLEKCHKRIKYYAKHGYEECVFEVPHSVIGMPVYDVNECLHYIHSKLQDNGFHVRIMPGNILHISWAEYGPREPKFVEAARLIEQPKFQPKPLVKKPKVQEVPKGNDWGSDIFAVDYFNPSSYQQSRMTPALMAAANTYEPDFDMMERPIPQRNMKQPLYEAPPKRSYTPRRDRMDSALAPRPATTRTREVQHTKTTRGQVKTRERPTAKDTKTTKIRFV